MCRAVCVCVYVCVCVCVCVREHIYVCLQKRSDSFHRNVVQASFYMPFIPV